MKPKISVIIAARNEEDNILNCLRKIPRYENLEVIMVDDSSEDRTYELAKHFNAPYEFRIFRNKQAAGNTYSWDYGVRKSNGELIFLLAADSELNSFDEAVKHFRDPGVVQVHQKIKITTEENFLSKLMPIYLNYVNYIPFTKKGIKKQTEVKNPRFCDSHSLMRKSFYLEVSPPVDKAAGEEYRFNDLGKRILEKTGCRIVYEPKFIENRENNFSLNRFLIQQRWYGRNMLAAYSFFDRRTFRKIFRFSFLISLFVLILCLFLENDVIYLLLLISTLLLLMRLFVGIFSLNKSEIRYLLSILVFILIGDLAYNYGFFQSFIHKMLKGEWLISK